MRVRGVNAEGNGQWAGPEAGVPGQPNRAPVYTSSSVTINVDENTASGADIGSAVTATDPDGDSLTYALGGTDSGHFAIVAKTGQIKTSGALDYESKSSYSVTVTASDGTLSDSIAVTVSVGDVAEPPDAPTGLKVGSTASGLTVTWTAPVMTGKPPLDGYNVEHRLRTSAADAVSEVWGVWTDVPHSDTTASASIGSLTPEAVYQVRVRGVNAEGNGQWAGPEAGVPEQPNRAPTFDDGLTASVNAAENQTAVATPDVTDLDGDDLTYRLDTAAVVSAPATNDHALFTMTGAGVLTFKAAPDFEAAKNSYTLVVEVRDSKDGAGKADTDWDDSIILTVNVTDVAEPPDAPTDLAVTPVASGLTVTWTAPVMTGKPPLDGYNVEHRLRTSAADAVSEVWGVWTDVPHSDTTASASIGSLTPEAVYQVRVRGVNAEGNGQWAGPEAGVPGQPNRAPVYTSSSVTINVDENTASGADIGSAVTATDPDGDSLTYALGGTDSGHFAIVAKTGQIKTSGALDYESKSSYSVTVTASDGTLSDSIAVTVSVGDVAEPPDAPTGLKVGSTASGLTVTWTAPVMTGKPPLDGYDVEHRLRTSADDAVNEVWGTWTDALHTGTAASASISGLTPEAVYQVRVRGVNAEGNGQWAGPEAGVPEQPNRAPVYTSSSVTINVDENTASGADIGSAVTATDPDGDSLTYALGGTDSGHFAIVAKTGQIKTSGALDYESKSSYSVTVTASDGTLSDSIAVTVSVGDVAEPPDAPTGLKVGSTASGLTVTWTAPVMTGKPPLDGYDVEHRLRTSADDAVNVVWGTWTDALHTGTAASASISGLTPEATYQVRVRGVNAEGNGQWAGPEAGVPEQPNRAPTFDDGLTASVNAAENQTAVATPDVTDLDGDDLTYRLDTAAVVSAPATNDHALFTMTGAGVLTFKAAPDFEAAKNSYTLVVEVRDSKDGAGKADTDWDDSIILTVNVTDVAEPPDAPTDLAVTPVASGLTVTWTAPVMTGKPPLDGYNVEHRLDAVSEVWGVWTDVPHSDTTPARVSGA